MNLAPKEEGATYTGLHEAMPQTLDEAVTYIEGKFETALDGPVGARDADGSPYVTVAFSARADTPESRMQLVWVWLTALMDMALKVPRNRLAWRKKPEFSGDGDGSIAIISRLAMN